MAFITNMFVRPTLARGSNALLNTWCRGYSTRIVGPAPGDILKTGDQGYKYFERNLERLRSHGRITYLASEQLVHVPKEDIVLFKELFQGLARQNETLYGEMRSLNAKVEQLLSAPGKTQ